MTEAGHLPKWAALQPRQWAQVAAQRERERMETKGQTPEDHEAELKAWGVTHAPMITAARWNASVRDQLQGVIHVPTAAVGMKWESMRKDLIRIAEELHRKGITEPLTVKAAGDLAREILRRMEEKDHEGWKGHPDPAEPQEIAGGYVSTREASSIKPMRDPYKREGKIMGAPQDMYAMGFRPPDDHWRKMKAVWYACESAGIDVPAEVDQFFDGMKPDPAGIEVDLTEVHGALHKSGEYTPVAREWQDDMKEGYEINIAELPKNITKIRIYMSY